jgi:hypothetical protein
MSLIDWSLVWPIVAGVTVFLSMVQTIYSVNHSRVRTGAIHPDQWAVTAKWLFPLILFLSCLIYGSARFWRLVQP